MASSFADFQAVASAAAVARYPLTAGVDPNWTHDRRTTYIQRLQECRRAPSYVQTPYGNLSVVSDVWMEEDSAGWRTVRRCSSVCRRSRCRTCARC